jgi:hypothetical protein
VVAPDLRDVDTQKFCLIFFASPPQLQQLRTRYLIPVRTTGL